AYGRDLRPEIGLTEVIGELEKIKPLSRIRLSSIEARDVSDALIKKIAGSKKLCRHLHIPIQSGDDKILKDMHRRYTRKDYLALFARLRRKIPSIAITTDVLVGFPGETEENFKNTLDLIKRVMPLKVHIFPYSKRNGTTAAQDTDKEVSTSIIKDRLCALKKLSETCADSYKKKFAHKKMLVLFEEEMKDRPGWWQGYTDNYILVQVKSNRNLRNKLISVTLGAGTVP
ncbi:MAG: radical SAM protein, partial [Candidatus Omnitrophica bacterium]|nr:radical SAM protein [Candidatus Omnitrophota bacterium]